ncbi:hypothetical protein E2C01_012884 [Portunus trituberculatus]|uniref:Uncharacterized protein n=1 Tax=Portunus trituberculatus TaxID=210409 RepID=A0A5B7DFW0_PORTR|nr:hypothetical protein [Portunus trituberculatus]
MMLISEAVDRNICYVMDDDGVGVRISRKDSSSQWAGGPPCLELELGEQDQFTAAIECVRTSVACVIR